MGEHSRVLTHGNRIFVNNSVSSDTVNKELQAPRDQWIRWFMVNKSFNTKVTNKTFAQVLSTTKLIDKTQGCVLRQGLKCNGQSEIPKKPCHKYSQCVPTKCVPTNSNAQVVHRKDTFSSNAGTGKLRLNSSTHDYYWPVSNKFQLLTNTSDDIVKNHHLVSHDTFRNKLEGNKNKTGLTLGKSCDSKHGMVHSTSVQGTENKTLKTLPPTIQVNCTKATENCHKAQFKFRGNKNGIRAKLGTEPQDDSGKDAKGPKQEIKQNVPSSHKETKSVAASHDLACRQQQLSDNMSMIYDTMGMAHKRKRNIPEAIRLNAFYSKDYRNCVQQNGRNFGFLPMNDLLVYSGEEIVWGDVPNIIQAHKIIRNSNMPNFMAARIPVNAQFNIPAWKSHLSKYWDKQIVDLLQYGFPLDFDRSKPLNATYQNHSSAIKFPEHINKYISTEIEYGAILGPFTEYPFPCHVSPFLTREKPHSENSRVILDLSFPVGQSVNDGVSKDKYLDTYFELNYPSVDTIVNSLKSLGSKALLYKIDISRAFRHIRIDPGDLDLLGIQHENLFIDRTLPFGFRHGSVFFQRCTDAIRYIMKNKYKFPYLYNYIDDLVYTGLPQDIHQSYSTLLGLLQELGLEISQSKLIAPTSCAVCLGIEINTVTKTLKIPSEKLQEIQQICSNFVFKSKVTKNQFQSLLGSLLYITKCVQPARFFLNRMLQLLRDNTTKPVITLDERFYKDLNWFNTFLSQYNGVTFYDRQKPQHTVHLDACLTGFGGSFNNMVYHLQIPLEYKNYTIVHLEILNIVVALKIWGKHWQDKLIELKCDNLAVVEVLRAGKARDNVLATCARNIWLLTSLFNIQLTTFQVLKIRRQIYCPDGRAPKGNFRRCPVLSHSIYGCQSIWITLTLI